ncbi:MAG: response regulator [Dehalococcoidales bacterium]|nr:response regulator [Dehalococcoidales bacterium]
MTKKSGKHTLLVIEDERDIQNFISRVLELEGYRVLRAFDGNSGLDIISCNIIDLILLDLRLPGLDGWSVLREIKRSREYSQIPVVVITAVAGSEERKQSLCMGAIQHLVKPLSARRLKRAIAVALN